MEFNTCEEYVLAELESAQEAVLTLNAVSYTHLTLPTTSRV